MKYLLIIHLNPKAFEELSEEERNEIFKAHDEFQKTTKETGELVGFAALSDPSEAKTVRVRDDVPAVTDGPFVEVKEHLAGFYIVDCETADRANELAALIPDARMNGIEVRPIMADSGLEM